MNTTGETINQISIAYLGEQWTSNANTNTLTFGYLLGGTSINDANFVADGNLNFTGNLTRAGTENANGTPLATANLADTIGGLLDARRNPDAPLADWCRGAKPLVWVSTTSLLRRFRSGNSRQFRHHGSR